MHSGMLVLCPSDLAHRTTLSTSNKEIIDIMKIVKFLRESMKQGNK